MGTLTEPNPISTMPGVFQLGERRHHGGAAGARARLGGVILAGLPKTKDAKGTSAYDPNGPCRAPSAR